VSGWVAAQRLCHRHHRPQSLGRMAVRASGRRMNHGRQVANGGPVKKSDNLLFVFGRRSPFMFEVMNSSYLQLSETKKIQ